MPEPRLGKATAELFEQVILRRLGAKDPDVLVGPMHGVDVGVVRVADGVVMALTADPVFVVPAYGWDRAAWFAVHILASDAATSGLPLRWMAVDLNLPPEVTDEELTALWPCRQPHPPWAMCSPRIGRCVRSRRRSRCPGTSGGRHPTGRSAPRR